MLTLSKALGAWGSPDFTTVLKGELEQLGAEHLPLQKGLSAGSYALDTQLSVMVIAASERAGVICAKAGVFYTGMVAGCSCADDPTPVEEHSEYCEVEVEIDKTTAGATVVLAAE